MLVSSLILQMPQQLRTVNKRQDAHSAKIGVCLLGGLIVFEVICFGSKSFISNGAMFCTSTHVKVRSKTITDSFQNITVSYFYKI
jgi:hypothetical protein